MASGGNASVSGTGTGGMRRGGELAASAVPAVEEGAAEVARAEAAAVGADGGEESDGAGCSCMGEAFMAVGILR